MTSTFIIDNLENRTNRLDAHFFDPEYFETIKKIRTIGRNRRIMVENLRDLLRKSKTAITGGATPTGAVYVTEGVPFLRIQNIREHRIDFEKAKLIPRIIHEKDLKRSQLKPHDVILTITGSYGMSAVVPENMIEANINQHLVKLEIYEDKIHPVYLSFFLNSELGRIQMDREVTGGTRPALDYPAIKSLFVVYPKDTDVQEKIIEKCHPIVQQAYGNLKKRETLKKNLDKIITDNLNMNLPKEFERKCFVCDISDWNRLDALSKSPYLRKLRKIIKNRKHEELGNLISVSTKEETPIMDFHKVIDIRKIEEKTGEFEIIETDNLDSAKMIIHGDELLICCLNPERGKSLLSNHQLEGLLTSTEFLPVKIREDKIDKNYLLVLLRSKIVLDQMKYITTGSTPSRGRITKNDLMKILIPMPNRKGLEGEIANKVFDNIKEMRELKISHNNLMKNAKDKFLELLQET